MEADALSRFGLLRPGDRVLCALSGGADSVCMTHLLASGAAERGVTVAAAHFSHGLRPESAGAERALCQRLCDALNIPLFCGEGDTPDYARTHGLGLEEAARDLRRAFLEETARAWNAGAIATGHHLEDSAETLLLNLIRGTGGRGMQGIPPKNGIFIRPLILMSKADILAYIRENRLEYAEDPTNHSGGNARAVLRREVFPHLTGLNSQAARHLARTALDVWQRDENIRMEADELTSRAHVAGGEASLPVRALLSAREEAAVRTLQALQRQVGGGMLERPHLRAVFDLCRGTDPSARADLPGSRAFRRYETLVLSAVPAASPPGSVLLTPEHPVEFGGWQVLLTGDSCGGGFAFPAERCLPALTVRSRQAGDSLSLAYGTKTVKKLLIERKIPKDLRDKIPIICNNKEILAVGDLCAAYLPQKESGDVLRVICRRNSYES